jgi:zinc transport system substrate-binding protein
MIIYLLFFATAKSIPRSEKIQVTTSFYPLAEFSRQVGGEFVDVRSLTPTGVEPHDFEPAPRQIQTIYESDLFVFNGGGVDAWASDLAPSIEKNGVQTLEMSGLMTTLLPATESEEEGENHEEELFDEHFWLSPTRAQLQLQAIRDALVMIDPAHATQYKMNADSFITELQKLDQEYKEGLAVCDIRVAVTSHAAFAYLAHDYDFQQLSITGLSPDEEPSAGSLAELSQVAKELGVKYVFFETLVNPELAQTLAREIGAQTLVFNPLEGLTEEELDLNKDYLRIMRDNLHNLRTAMLCQ